MLKLTHGDRNAGITVVEDPREVVGRLGRVDTESPELAGFLMSMDPVQLQRLANQTQTALARVAPHTVEKSPENRELAYQTFQRPEEFGD